MAGQPPLQINAARRFNNQKSGQLVPVFFQTGHQMLIILRRQSGNNNRLITATVAGNHFFNRFRVQFRVFQVTGQIGGQFLNFLFRLLFRRGNGNFKANLRPGQLQHIAVINITALGRLRNHAQLVAAGNCGILAGIHNLQGKQSRRQRKKHSQHNQNKNQTAFPKTLILVLLLRFQRFKQNQHLPQSTQPILYLYFCIISHLARPVQQIYCIHWRRLLTFPPDKCFNIM